LKTAQCGDLLSKTRREIEIEKSPASDEALILLEQNHSQEKPPDTCVLDINFSPTLLCFS
jgi:hypothetical protein